MARSGSGAVGTTLRTPGVLLGMLAMLLIAVAVMTPGFVPNHHLDRVGALRALRWVLQFQVGRVLMVVGLALLFWAWLKLRPALHLRLNHGLILALWSLPILLAPPVFSSDAFLYADQGWIISQGFDPYQVGLTEAGGPFADNVHWVWSNTTAVYPPAALLVQYLVVELTGYHSWWSVIAMRIPAVLAVVVIVAFVPRLARLLRVDPELAKWFAVLNPLLILHFVGGVHNDAWMVALVLVAVFLALRFGVSGMLVGAALVGVGAAFKQPGIAAAIAVGLLPVAGRLKHLSLGRRVGAMAVHAVAALAIAVGVFVGVSFAIGYEFLGWAKATSIHESTWGMSPASMVEQFIGPVINAIGIRHGLLPFLSRVATITSVLAGAVIAWRYFFADRVGRRQIRPRSVHVVPGGEVPDDDRGWRDYPLRWLAWSFTALAFGGAGYHVWYLLWGGIYLGLLRYGNRMFRGFVAVMIAFVVVEGGLEYFSLRPIPGYLLGIALAWIFWVNSSRLQIVREPAPDDAAEAKAAQAA
ncbi:polyprenol phosphomannose-dependent alpha 1,6 mannosyltransferase MptB [Granulicoccus sp. GXG6511]|uniref:polyprenol phosphomannose-dependent alpha 1,6 mannosyltransferase MptB n=1 Tax=Granulicoccus sp. GXG6511 TaxID=3381351 RepID=UPI003D7E9671